MPNSYAPVSHQYDGKRMLVGCSREHLEELVEQYKRRPFLDAELWAGKIARVLRRHPEGISEEDLARESGLTHEQIQRGVMWQNTEAQRWLEQHSQDGDDAPDSHQ
ncbi:hypothetical protein ACFYZJ_31225 [Streptomyces sp. NPDC001848]|uniref:hypothetical protein n=1 Tax=Streptomyces sp. NPDC001848 TaxID=3364618 RepID=UPI003675BC82